MIVVGILAPGEDVSKEVLLSCHIHPSTVYCWASENGFKGFSEAVTQTKSSWASLFSSDFYRNLLRQQPDQQRRHALKEFVERYLTFKAQCRRHCDKPSSFFELWFDLKNFVGAYVCSSGYVSRVVYFSLNPDKNWFRKYLTSQVGESVVAEYDLRPATRHGWELGSDALTSIREINPDDTIQEIYWTIYPKTDEEKRCGVFLCSDSEGKQKCNRLFVQDLNSQNRLCPACR